MNFLKLFLSKKNRFFLDIFFKSRSQVEIQRWENYTSTHLKRTVIIEVILPPAYYEDTKSTLPILFLNDGQDIPALRLLETLEKLFHKKTIIPFILVAVHAGDRMQEYGTAGQADYKGRGAKAAAYTDFMLKELLPELERRYRISPLPKDHVIAGFSLGGLSAFDIAWEHSTYFGKVGIFSGSLWWRSVPFDPKQPDAGRIPQAMVESGKKRDNLRFWFQAGTKDETSDRNKNGIIDAIDDTLQLMAALQRLGYNREQDITYTQVKGGKHHPATWGKVIPDFLKWAFPKKDNKPG